MINLMPTENKVARLYGWRNLSLVRSVIFLVVAVLILAIKLGYGYVTLDQTANNVAKSAELKGKEVQDLDELQKEAQGLSDTIKTASILLNRETKFSDLIQKIGSVMPEGASLKGLRLTGDTKLPLEITATLTSFDQAAVLQKNLLTSDLFQAADIQSVDRKQTINDAQVVVSEDIEATILLSYKQTAAPAKPKPPEGVKP